MNNKQRLSAFDAFGIELEYMLVDHDSMDVRPVADRVLESATGKITSDFESGEITWSNELALHVIELKGSQPTADLITLAASMQEAVRQLQPALAANHVSLLPTAMHPWMDPTIETKLWPHECHEIYQAYHNIFNCFSHGWANVQSVHLNLPFANDEEFSRLHAAVRILLPILPALTASSPVVDGQLSDWADTRMRWVRSHCERVPFLTGELIPEPIFDEANYQSKIFSRLSQVIAPLDSNHVFESNFLNARGAIARFDRGSIEIRVMDVQENPATDIAICIAVIAVLKAMVAERWQSTESQQSVATTPLSILLDQVSKSAEASVIADRSYLQQFGITAESVTASQLWRMLLDAVQAGNEALAEVRPTLDYILDNGSLATRIRSAIGTDCTHEKLVEIYARLTSCLQNGERF